MAPTHKFYLPVQRGGLRFLVHSREATVSPCKLRVAFVTTATPALSGHSDQRALRPGSAGMPTIRRIHSSTRRSSLPNDQLAIDERTRVLPIEHQAPDTSALAVLPLSMVLRSLATTTISSSPWLLPPSLAIMSALAHSTNPLLDPDRNPVLRFLLKNTFYAQFCAGENALEVKKTVDRLKDIGFTGVILGYAKEVVLTGGQTQDLASCAEGPEADDCIRNEIMPWANGTMETVRLAQPGDFVALKFTGAGRQAMHSLAKRLPPPPALAKSIDSICSLASERGIRLLFDAEHANVQAGIDDWTLKYMQTHNTVPGKAVIYGTYQAYLKSTPQTLRQHLDAAREGRFTLGVKLVRGAYLGSDPRYLMHDDKAGTDAAYDGIAENLLLRRWEDVELPPVSLVLASHNEVSVRRARAICDAGQAKIEVAFAQLQGMADEVSCALVSARRSMIAAPEVVVPMTLDAYKYLVWGSTGECMRYLLRRAEENRDAVQRTRSGRDAMWAEVLRRARTLFGLSA